jgi:hypothetical protein
MKDQPATLALTTNKRINTVKRDKLKDEPHATEP